MTYEGLRYLILAISIIIILLIYKIFINKKDKKSKIKKVFIVVVVIWIVFNFTIVWITPFEKSFMSFNTLEETFNYTYHGGQIKYIFQGEDYAFVIFNYNGAVSQYDNFVKENGKWQVHSPTQRNIKIIAGPDVTSILTDFIPEKNVMLICVGFPATSEENIVLSDSVNSEFKLMKEEPFVNDLNSCTYIVIVKDIPNDYYLSINGEKMSLSQIAKVK
ncbi:MAG: hypothetical protein FWF46_09460 [Oscillospiraceae bacterium]|nr:hypothetical protein [Oscillospiraceae bacterium]